MYTKTTSKTLLALNTTLNAKDIKNFKPI